jgi:hypothetical protein
MMCKCSAQRDKYQSVTTMKFAGDNTMCQNVFVISKIVINAVIYFDRIHLKSPSRAAFLVLYR